MRSHPVAGALVQRPIARLARSGVPVPRRITDHLPYHGEFTTACPAGGSFRMHSRGDYLETAVYFNGVHGHEPETIAAWMALAPGSDVILDIGANTGLYALIASAVAPASRVHAFEPVPRVAERLRLNRSLNPSFELTVHECAVGAATGTGTLHDPGAANEYSASLRPGFREGESMRSYTVEVIAVDDFVRRHELPSVDLVKLDVEGFEASVLDGMRETLERYRPAIVMELLDDDDAAVMDHLGRLMGDGYALYHLTREGARRSPRPTRSPDAMNILVVPESRSLGGLEVVGEPAADRMAR